MVVAIKTKAWKHLYLNNKVARQKTDPRKIQYLLNVLSKLQQAFKLGTLNGKISVLFKQYCRKEGVGERTVYRYKPKK